MQSPTFTFPPLNFTIKTCTPLLASPSFPKALSPSTPLTLSATTSSSLLGSLSAISSLLPTLPILLKLSRGGSLTLSSTSYSPLVGFVFSSYSIKSPFPYWWSLSSRSRWWWWTPSDHVLEELHLQARLALADLLHEESWWLGGQ